MSKSLLKKGRRLEDYVKDGELIVDCLTCLHRHHIPTAPIGDLLCKVKERFDKCNPRADLDDYLLWEARINYDDYFIDKEEFKIE
jgi:hypothetical protein